MAMTAPDLLSALRTERLLAIVRGSDPGAALDTVLALFHSGVRVVEVSLTSTDALDVITRARDRLGETALLGAGTVLTAVQARRSAEAGASFTVTPGLTEAVAESRALGLPVLAGAVTPTEVIAAVNEGATAVKLFPAALGGAAYLRALRDPFPDVPFVPVGGIDSTAARAYLAAGALAVGVGSPLVGRAAHGEGLDGLAERSEQFRTVALGAR
ncbi:bifunctional 4-hydroxy-2-oxoglutarate aldolase/2-dehydro-3-deoxy-phosphogluconate aldolase [Streptomyces sp. NPDC049967]|uniref:bifunctional 4-hydroxy-2-oxoglutarate aldolase/2-dehydro-3-deoxy-phosphogluconate aldolase n=1 Tax=unclassified Streptomyces TaxID=2593676 RepID=UPI002E104122|nr:MULTISPECIES: bifunctional 4-hydroxy-2-oxoglutarate aldolase/2-dehydro-3-deoxy-phosphogluconate aldolase [unclassified Streptomyces]WSJ23848.1 bifunctional 4-hydroxy-2-oxoglutarate aldolase/2-dehydro-3-deoxy-phosphogluconate aldolase [Streptomyces sp. NBC_01324]